MSRSEDLVIGIEQRFLKSNAIVGTSAAKKLHWASDRITTREEDHAYCLLGLLDVNMPLLYGEGKYGAFRRLQKEFIRRSEDESILAWTASEPVNWVWPCGILAKGPSDFRSIGDMI